MCCWLAIIISGSNQAVRIKRGLERESEKKNNEKLKLFLFDWFGVNKHSILISRLKAVELIQTMLFFENHVIGMSIIVGIITFSLVRGLDFVHCPFPMSLIL
jgi:hypothetical protein